MITPNDRNRRVWMLALLAGLLAPASAGGFALNQWSLNQVLGNFQAPPARVARVSVAVPAPGRADDENQMVYRGGPLMLGPKHLYYIWYGDWSKKMGAVQILQDFGGNIGGSPYFNINTTYYDGVGRRVENAVTLSAAVFDRYSMGAFLRRGDIAPIVGRSIRGGLLPKDPMGVYFVLTSPDVDVDGFCFDFCAWHRNMDVNGADIKYAFVGNSDRCPGSCYRQTVSPNGDAGADGMASFIAHELEEAVTDPDSDAWRTIYNYENGDMCAWNFGDTKTLPNGAKYNLTFGRRKFLIQQNWVNDPRGGYCAQAYP